MPDLILLDVRMPGLSGCDVAKIIKESLSLKHIPLLAFSASVFSNEKNIETSHFDEFLFKPINKTELVSKLMKYLKHKLQEVNFTEGPEKIIQPENIEENIIPLLPEIVQFLNNDFLPRWESIEKQLVLFKIEEFASDLLKFAKEYEFQYLIDYTNKLIDELEIVDLEAIENSLQLFPTIIQGIKAFLKK